VEIAMKSVPLRLSVLLVLLLAGAVHAQVYRIVGPDGKVTYSDKPPPAAAPPARGGAAATPGADGGALPYELRQITGKFPVTLYTGQNCQACPGARALLTQRGIPFTEKTVSSGDDVAALQRLTGAALVPSATVGGQQLQGFLDTDWEAVLDAAGYPKSSQLPPAYRNPAASPLVAVRAAPAASASSAPAQGSAAATAPPPAPRTEPTQSNPTGIRF
jgi:Domain of unknown function (DUF4124)/Glutaredoxin